MKTEGIKMEMLNVSEFGVVKLANGGLSYLPSKKSYKLSAYLVSLIRS